jgi:hypothetical protein
VDSSEADQQRMADVNLMGMFLIARATGQVAPGEGEASPLVSSAEVRYCAPKTATLKSQFSGGVEPSVSLGHLDKPEARVCVTPQAPNGDGEPETS